MTFSNTSINSDKSRHSPAQTADTEDFFLGDIDASIIPTSELEWADLEEAGASTAAATVRSASPNLGAVLKEEGLMPNDSSSQRAARVVSGRKSDIVAKVKRFEHRMKMKLETQASTGENVSSIDSKKTGGSNHALKHNVGEQQSDEVDETSEGQNAAVQNELVDDNHSQGESDLQRPRSHPKVMPAEDAPVPTAQMDLDAIKQQGEGQPEKGKKPALRFVEQIASDDEPIHIGQTDANLYNEKGAVKKEHAEPVATAPINPPHYLEQVPDDTKSEVSPTTPPMTVNEAINNMDEDTYNYVDIEQPDDPTNNSNDNNDDGTPLPELEAIPVEDAVYNAVCVDQNGMNNELSSNHDPWWKRHKRSLFGGILLAIIGAIAVVNVVIFASSRNNDGDDVVAGSVGGDQEQTSSPSMAVALFSPSPSSLLQKPTKSPSLSPTKLSTLRPTSARPTDSPSHRPWEVYVQSLLDVDCDGCSPQVGIDRGGSGTAIVTSSPSDITIMSHLNGQFSDLSVIQTENHRGPVAISEDVIAVGYPIGSGGKVHLWERNTSNDGWTRLPTIKPSDITNGEEFGSAMAIGGDFIVIGAPDEDWLSGAKGAAYLYKRSQTGSSNYQVKKFTPKCDKCLELGRSVAISTKLNSYTDLKVALGDPSYGKPLYGLVGGSREGVVFVFTTGSFNKTVIHKPDDCNLYFGKSVEFTTDQGLLVGCPGGSESGASGAVYFYSHTEDGLSSSPQRIVSSDRHLNYQFGWDIATDGNTMAVGTNKESGGKVYIFTKRNGLWVEVAMIDAPEGRKNFGQSVAMSGNTLVVSSKHNAFSYSLRNY